MSKSLAFFDASSISRIFSYPKNLITSLRRRKGPEKVGRLSSSNAVYSGILRLSDLRAEAPNSNYPLFIVASEDRRRKVFEELKRPTFSGPCLRLNEVIRFLGYKKVRELDESSKGSNSFEPNDVLAAGESVPMSL